MSTFTGWLIAETPDGNNIEYWAGGKCVLSLSTESVDLAVLERIKKLLTYVEAAPPAAG